MPTGYNMTQTGSGGFVPQRTGSSGVLGYQAIPFSQGRSTLATIPEFQRNPMLLEKSLLMTIQEGRANLTKYLYEYAEKNGKQEFNDVKYRWRVEVIPHARFYLAPGTYAASSTNNGRTVLKLNTFTKPSSVAFSNGNPNVIGDIARLQEGQHILIMCSFTNKSRSVIATVKTDPAGSATTYNGKPSSKYPVPEIAKIETIDYATGEITVLRNWAGAQRTVSNPGGGEILVQSDNAAPNGATKVKKDDAFFILLPKTMPEDEIDAKIMNYTTTWQENIMKRTVKAWGDGYFQRVINANLGNKQPGVQSKEIAIKTFYDEIGWDAIWGEKQEGFEDGMWWGHTDGLLTNIDAGHYIGIAPMNHTILRSTPANAYGSFDIPTFNKLLEDKGYYGSDRKVMLCGSRAYTDFATMINQMTQNIPDIKSDWKVVGKSFMTSNGLTVDFIPTDVFSLNGMNNYMVMFDPSAFKMVGLKGYPTDMHEISNENPLKVNGFIHGVYSFLDMNPDAHWVFVLDDNYMGTSASAPKNVLGKPQSEFTY